MELLLSKLLLHYETSVGTELCAEPTVVTDYDIIPFRVEPYNLHRACVDAEAAGRAPIILKNHTTTLPRYKGIHRAGLCTVGLEAAPADIGHHGATIPSPCPYLNGTPQRREAVVVISRTGEHAGITAYTLIHPGCLEDLRHILIVTGKMKVVKGKESLYSY